MSGLSPDVGAGFPGEYRFSMLGSLADDRPKIVTLADLRMFVSECLCAELVDRIRAEPDKARRSELKRGLPCVTISGEFAGGHKAEHLVRHSVLLCVDFDAADNPDMTGCAGEWRDRLAKDEAARLRLQAENERKLREQAEAAARAERAAAEARAKAERDRILAEQAAARAERAAAEARAKAERDRILAEQAAVRAETERAAKAPDREKILAFAAAVDGLNARIPALASEKGRAFETALRMQVAKFHQWVSASAEKL